MAFLLGVAVPAFGVMKIFSGGGDGVSWHDAQNWLVGGIPLPSDIVTIDQSGVFVKTSKDFLASSVTVGGKSVSTWSVEPFVFGTVVPATPEEPAIFLRKGGTLLLKGNGTVVLKGSFKNSEESLPTEPSMMILLE